MYVFIHVLINAVLKYIDVIIKAWWHNSNDTAIIKQTYDIKISIFSTAYPGL